MDLHCQVRMLSHKTSHLKFHGEKNHLNRGREATKLTSENLTTQMKIFVSFMSLKKATEILYSPWDDSENTDMGTKSVDMSIE